MPPPPTRPGKRMTANPIRPGRYRPGKAVAEEASSDEEDGGEEREEQDEGQEQMQSALKPQPPKFSSGRQAAATASNLKNLNLEERRRQDLARERRVKEEERRERERMEREAGFVTESEDGSGPGTEEDEQDDEDDNDGNAKRRPNGAISRTTQSTTSKPAPGRRKGDSSSSASGESGSGSDEKSDSEDTDSSDSSTNKPTLKRPIFVRKADRGQDAPTNTTSTPTTPAPTTLPQPTPAPTTLPQPTPAPPDDPSTRKKETTNDLLQRTLDLRAAEAASASLAWDESAAELDDTDGLDPELEHAEWVARELARVKRSRAALEEREAEIAEVDRRRNLTTPEREAEDALRTAETLELRKERADAAKASKEEGGGYMKRYHHSGAFSAGDEEAERRLRERDLMNARFEGEVRMKSALPEYLQVRDETMIGRKGRQRHRDLRGEDTGQWGGGFDKRGGRGREGGGGNGASAEDERFRPDRPGDGRDGPTGATAGMVGERKRPGGFDDRGDAGKRYRREGEVR